MTGRMVQGAAGALHIRVDGPEGAPWIVLSNSLGANLTMWDGQVDLLTRKYRVLRYDTRGHGLSETVATPFGFPDLVADMVAVMDACGAGRADVLGLSLGGMTGLGLALTHPDRLGKLVCADARAVATEPVRQMWDARIAAVGDGGLAAILEGTLASWFTADWRADNAGIEQRIRDMILATDPVGYLGCCHALKELDYLRRLGEIRAPVLYIVGSEDKGAPPAEMREMADATPGARFVEIPGAGHLANVNAPAPFNTALIDFLDIPTDQR